MAFATEIYLAWKSILFLQISEIKFLGKWNHERRQSEANANATPKTGEKNVTSEPSTTKCELRQAPNLRYSVTSRNNIGPKSV